MRLALFDFDGTLTSEDSLQHFIIFSIGRWKYIIGLMLLSPILVSYFLGLISNDKAKEILVGYFFKGWSVSSFNEIAERYSLNEIQKIIRPKAMERIEYHQANNDRIIVVSASLRPWIEPWCRSNKIEVIATTLQDENGIITGRFSSKNCNGPEKVVQIRKIVNLESYDKIFAYGDSSGDMEMLELATDDLGFKKLFH
ncbi:MAG: HAD family hydrolase [Bacteroidota bacterium]